MSSIIDQTLKTVIETATGESVYALRKPIKTSLPAITYMRVTDTPQVTQSGSSGNIRVRYQITVEASSYSSLRTIADAVESAMLANTTNFSVSLPLEGQFENKDENASIYTSVRDYFVWYNVTNVSVLQAILSTQFNNLIQYLPLNEDVGSEVAIDNSGKGNSGLYSGVTLGATGIGDGLTAATFDGTASYVDLYSPTFNAEFNGAEGTMLVYGKVSGAGIWTDGNLRMTTVLRAVTANRVLIRRSNAANSINIIRDGGGVSSIININGINPTDYFFVAITWSEAADEFKAYYKDASNPFAQSGATQTGLGVFAGALSTTLANVGAENQSGTQVWSGELVHHAVWNTPLTEDELNNIAIY